MYQMIAGLGSWARYWAVLRYGVVQFWKYPDEAYEKVCVTHNLPLGSLDRYWAV